MMLAFDPVLVRMRVLVLAPVLMLALVLVWVAKKHPRVQTEQVAMVPVPVTL